MRVVIVGAGQAGYSLASKLRGLGFEDDIVLIGDEPHLPYQRPPLSKAYLFDNMTADRLAFRTGDFYVKNRIELRTGSPAVEIDRRTRTVHLNGRDRIRYDKLVLTTGSRPRNLPAGRGGELTGVHLVRSIGDSDRLKAHVEPGKHVFVAGGGYIGLEIAAACRLKRAEVTLVEAADRLLARVAGPETAAFFERIHKERGVVIRTGIGVKCLEGGEGTFRRAILADDSVIEADVAVVGIGVVPNVELAGAAGLAIDNGIAVDESCRTSDQEIFAAGDCSSFPWRNGRLRLESVQNAIDQAEAAAEAVLGRPVAYRPIPWFWSDQYEFKLQTVGLSSGYDRVVETPGQRPGGSSIWYFRDGEAIAVDSINDPKTHMAVRKLFGVGGKVQYDAVQRGLDLNELVRSAMDAQKR